MVNHWTKHVRSSIELERRAAEAAEQTGDLQVACYSRNDVVKLLLATGAPLGEARRNAEDALAFVRKAKFGLVVDTLDHEAQVHPVAAGIDAALLVIRRRRL